jgi:hypothetical protein
MPEDKELSALRDPIAEALRKALKYLDPNESICRGVGGSTITASQMLLMLENKNPAANEFIRDIYGAALRTVMAIARVR